MTELDDRIEQAHQNPVIPPSHRRLIMDEYGHEVLESVACWCAIGHDHERVEAKA